MKYSKKGQNNNNKKTLVPRDGRNKLGRDDGHYGTLPGSSRVFGGPEISSSRERGLWSVRGARIGVTGLIGRGQCMTNDDENASEDDAVVGEGVEDEAVVLEDEDEDEDRGLGRCRKAEDGRCGVVFDP